MSDVMDTAHLHGTRTPSQKVTTRIIRSREFSYSMLQFLCRVVNFVQCSAAILQRSCRFQGNMKGLNLDHIASKICNNLRKGCLWSILKRALEKIITYFINLILICHAFSWPLRRSLKGHPWKQLLYETLAILSDTRTYEWTQLNEVTMYFALEPIGRGSLYLTNAYNSTFRAQLCSRTVKRIFAISQRWGDVDDNISFIDLTLYVAASPGPLSQNAVLKSTLVNNEFQNWLLFGS